MKDGWMEKEKDINIVFFSGLELNFAGFPGTGLGTPTVDDR